jgi:hypothetical protein
VGMTQLRKLGIPAILKKGDPDSFVCVDCTRGKIHKMPHKELHGVEKEKFLPGEKVFTDLCGPYTRSFNGHHYTQIF